MKVFTNKKKMRGYREFLYILPFIILVAIFAYYPLYGWAYTFLISIYTEVYKSRKYNHFSRATERFSRKFANFAQDMRGTQPHRCRVRCKTCQPEP